jgi:hypothetical protein
MHAEPETLIAVVIAMIGGLLGFATLLLAGVALVRALRLPQDLPDGPRFEPPPPPLQEHGERSLAVQAAQRQAALAVLYARARDLELGAHECQALQGQLGAAPAAPADAGAAAELIGQLQAASAASAAAAAALRAFDARLRAAPGADAGNAALSAELALGEPVVQGALVAARRLAASAPAQPQRRRLLLLLVAFLLLWLAALAAMLWR